MNERTIWVVCLVATRVRISGGDRVAQDAGAIYAKQLLKEGCTAAHSIQAGYQAGKRFIKDKRVTNIIPLRRRGDNKLKLIVNI